jgi:hypothetical protein
LIECESYFNAEYFSLMSCGSFHVAQRIKCEIVSEISSHSIYACSAYIVEVDHANEGIALLLGASPEISRGAVPIKGAIEAKPSQLFFAIFIRNAFPLSVNYISKEK